MRELDEMAEPEHASDGNDVQYPPSGLKEHYPIHIRLLFPKDFAKGIDQRQHNQMHPPPPHVRVAEEPFPGNDVLVRFQGRKPEYGETQQKFSPQYGDIREHLHAELRHGNGADDNRETVDDVRKIKSFPEAEQQRDCERCHQPDEKRNIKHRAPGKWMNLVMQEQAAE